MLSPRLQSLIDRLSNPDVITRVRLVRETKAAYEAEHPTAAKGAAQAAGANRVRAAKKGNVAPDSGVTPFADWLAEQLHLGVTTVRTLIARADYIPEEALRHIEGLDEISSIGGLLEHLVKMLREDPSADWHKAIQHQVNPVVTQGGTKSGGVFMSNRVMFFGLDATDHLKQDIELGVQYDAIVVDPPYGMRHRGRVNGPMIDDDKGSLWSVPLLAQLLKPGRPLCLWTNKGRLGHWTMALLDVGLTIHQLVRWDKGPIAATRRYEYMLVAGVGAIQTGVSVLEEPTLPRNAPERDYHDTPKPVALMEKVLQGWTQDGDIILDCFAGTASIARAAMRHNRRCVAYEISDDIAVFASTELRKERDRLRFEAQMVAATNSTPKVPDPEVEEAGWRAIDEAYAAEQAALAVKAPVSQRRLDARNAAKKAVA